LSVRKHASPSDEYLLALGQVQSLGDLGRGCSPGHFNLGGCLSAGGEGIAKECTLPSLAFPAAKALVAEPPQRWSGSDEHAPTVLNVEQAFGSQYSNGLAYRHTRGLVSVHEYPLGG
jgi:hypothetical protein